MSRRHWLLLTLVAILVLSVGVFGVWVMTSLDDGPHHTAALGPVASTTSSIQLKLTHEAARNLESQLTSRNEATYRSAWAHGNVPPMMPVDSAVTITVDSFAASQNIGSVQAIATVPGKPPYGLRMLLLAQGGRWKIISIEEVK